MLFVDKTVGDGLSEGEKDKDEQEETAEKQAHKEHRVSADQHKFAIAAYQAGKTFALQSCREGIDHVASEKDAKKGIVAASRGNNPLPYNSVIVSGSRR
jgi:G3E family GTPase